MNILGDPIVSCELASVTNKCNMSSPNMLLNVVYLLVDYLSIGLERCNFLSYKLIICSAPRNSLLSK